jgi:hypothetical protein
MYEKHIEWGIEKPEHFPLINAIGYAPISLQKAQSETQRMLMAIEASKLAAYVELAEQVYGQKISASTSMSDLVVNNKVLTASVDGVIRGAKVVRSYPVGDDTYATELQVDFKEVYDIYIATSRPSRIKDVKYY